jgi:hypothetical protein
MSIVKIKGLCQATHMSRSESPGRPPSGKVNSSTRHGPERGQPVGRQRAGCHERGGQPLRASLRHFVLSHYCPSAGPWPSLALPPSSEPPPPCLFPLSLSSCEFPPAMSFPPHSMMRPFPAGTGVCGQREALTGAQAPMLLAQRGQRHGGPPARYLRRLVRLHGPPRPDHLARARSADAVHIERHCSASSSGRSAHVRITISQCPGSAGSRRRTPAGNPSGRRGHRT